MNIYTVQFDIQWHSPEANFRKIERLLEKKDLKNSIVVLPEMFNTGYTMHPEEVEGYAQITINWLKNFSYTNNCLITGSIPVNNEGKYFNRLYAFAHGNNVAIYEKRHLFSNAGEDKIYSAGNSIISTKYNGLSIRFAICYDLRFPVWLRNTELYDILIVVANWPAKRDKIWEILLKARAIENQATVVGVNRIGTDKNGFSYAGNSLIINAKGEILAKCNDNEAVCKINFDKKEQDGFREKFDTLKDADNFNIIL